MSTDSCSWTHHYNTLCICDVNLLLIGNCFELNRKLQISHEGDVKHRNQKSLRHDILNCVAVDYLCAWWDELSNVWTTILDSKRQICVFRRSWGRAEKISIWRYQESIDQSYRYAASEGLGAAQKKHVATWRLLAIFSSKYPRVNQHTKSKTVLSTPHHRVFPLLTRHIWNSRLCIGSI